MIKREFVENNLLKVLDYLPAHFIVNNKEYFLYISKLYNGLYVISYADVKGFTLYLPASKFNLIDAIIYSIEQLDKYIPDFINNLIDI